MAEKTSILITGASSGIGEALARLYAAPGRHLALTGQDEALLAAVAADCRAKEATVLHAAVDVRDAEAMQRFISAAEEARPLDLVIANAGISADRRTPQDLDRRTRDIFAVNVTGVFNTLHPAIPPMLARRQGQLAIVSSIAALRGMPGAAAYSASKAAIKAYGEALRGRLAHHGVAVNVILPGFVRSRMTADNPFPMPLLMDASRAAQLIARGLAANRGRIAFPWPTYIGGRLLAALPEWLMDRIARHMPGKDG